MYRVNETKIKEFRINLNSKHLRPIKSHDKGIYEKKKEIQNRYSLFAHTTGRNFNESNSFVATNIPPLKLKKTKIEKIKEKAESIKATNQKRNLKLK